MGGGSSIHVNTYQGKKYSVPIGENMNYKTLVDQILHIDTGLPQNIGLLLNGKEANESSDIKNIIKDGLPEVFVLKPELES